MKRYLRLYYQFLRNRLMREMEFRMNLFVWTSMNLFWFGLGLVSIELIFGQIESIAGWKKDEVLLLVCTTALFFDFLWTFVLDSINNFSHLIRHGNLDLILLKPVNTRFFVSTREPEFDHYLRMILLIYIIIKILARMAVGVGALSWLGYWLIFLMAVFAFYNLVFFLAVTNFWFIRLFNTSELIESTVNIGRYPVEIFKNKLRFFFTYLVPTAFVAYFPVLILLGRANFRETVLICLLIDILTFVFSQWFWRFALKRYSSASS